MPWPMTMASSSLSPRAVGPRRSSFSRGRSSSDNRFMPSLAWWCPLNQDTVWTNDRTPHRPPRSSIVLQMRTGSALPAPVCVPHSDRYRRLRGNGPPTDESCDHPRSPRCQMEKGSMPTSSGLHRTWPVAKLRLKLPSLGETRWGGSSLLECAAAEGRPRLRQLLRPLLQKTCFICHDFGLRRCLVALSAPYILLFLTIALLAAACDEPPSKELNQARGAVDAARAAGAREYAQPEFQAALDALERASNLANQRDYRQALNYALDARERAHDAARQAADMRARARGDAERAVQAVQTRLEHASSLLTAAREARLPTRAVRPLVEAVDATEQVLQEARSALDRQDFARAIAALDDIGPQLPAAIDEVYEMLVERAKKGGKG
ncbi:MAG: DUF4398 domain-containing protein [Luteitalea sp.]|nr:DUF4398 domain-containing protein [Luteitalea sp.]